MSAVDERATVAGRDARSVLHLGGNHQTGFTVLQDRDRVILLTGSTHSWSTLVLIVPGRRRKMMFLIEGDEIVGRFPEDSDEPYRVARDGAVIIDKDSAITIDWRRDLAVAAMELSDTTLSCERAAVLAIPGAADTVASMRRLCDEIDARLKEMSRDRP